MNVVSLLPASKAYPFLKLVLQYLVDPDIGCRSVTDFPAADIIKTVFTTVRDTMAPKFGPLLEQLRTCHTAPAYQFLTPNPGDTTTVNVCSGYYRTVRLSWSNVYEMVRGVPPELYWIGGVCSWNTVTMVQHALQRLNHMFIHTAFVMAGLIVVEFKGKELPVCRTREALDKLWLRLICHVVPQVNRWMVQSLQQILDLLNEALSIS